MRRAGVALGAVVRSALLALGGVIAASLLLAACGASGVPTSLASSVPSDSGAARDERDCLWLLDSRINTLFPDRYAQYWVAALVIPPGGAVTIDGEFPAARYISFNLYDEQLAPIDALTDVEIVPAAGSTNPFVEAANRYASPRAYQLRLIPAVPPADPAQRAPNTLYSARTLGPVAVPANLAVLFYRRYVPDVGREAAALPRIRFELADGRSISGPAACGALDRLSFAIPDLAALPDPVADLPVNTAAFVDLLWLKFFSAVSSQGNRVFATPLGPAVYETIGSPTEGGGGFASNRDNRYIYASISQQLGPVVALHGRFPSAPVTSDGRSPMPGGSMRYWSICTNDGNTLAVFSCLYDEQLRTDVAGRGIIVVSRDGDRPANATEACGISWLDWGAADNAVLIYRHMLPQPEAVFPQAIQYIPGPPGQFEASVMGEYFPYGHHMSRAEFEALGCPVDARRLPAVVTPPPTAG